MRPNFLLFIFTVDVILLNLLLVGVVWSILFPEKRIWPPPGKHSWQYRLTWISFYLVFFLNALLVFFDWNSGLFTGLSRLIIGIPLVVIGTWLVSWGIYTLGVANTSGLSDGFMQAGPYRFTRNPQYLGDILLFIGLSLVANSGKLWIAHGLLILVFLLTPFTEEVWLEEQYGETYRDYKRSTSRFF